MKNIAENCLVRFMSISKKKDGIFANYKVKGLRNSTTFTTTISVDVAAAELDTTYPLDAIIEKCAHLAVREFDESELQFEGMAAN